MQITEQLNTLTGKVNLAADIVTIKAARREFVSACFDFADFHKCLERGHEFQWYKRFDPVISVLDREMETGHLKEQKIQWFQIFKPC